MTGEGPKRNASDKPNGRWWDWQSRYSQGAFAIGALGYVLLATLLFMLPPSLFPTSGLLVGIAGVIVVVSGFIWGLAPPGWGTKLGHVLGALGIAVVATPLLLLSIRFFLPLLCLRWGWCP